MGGLVGASCSCWSRSRPCVIVCLESPHPSPPPEYRERGWRRRRLLIPELSAVLGAVAEGFLDSQELVVLRDAVAAGRGAGLDLATVGRDRDVSDRRVLGLA